MVGSQTAAPLQPRRDVLPPISGNDSIRYTKDMLTDLRRMAVGREQLVLAHLLEAAGREAERLLREPGCRDLRPVRRARRDGG